MRKASKTSFFVFCLPILTLSPLHAQNSQPRLVLQITIDALRGDLPYRYYDQLSENGFRYLLDKGTVYTDAHHAHANTETIVGHATLATGAHPQGQICPLERVGGSIADLRDVQCLSTGATRVVPVDNARLARVNADERDGV